MTADLRPMSLGEILDRTFQIYRARFWSFIGISAIPALAYLALGLVLLFLDEYGPSTTLPASSKAAFKEAASWLPVQWQYSFFLCILWPVIVFFASRIFLNEEVEITSAYSWCKAHWKSYLGLASALWVVWHLLPNVLSRMAMSSEIAASASHILDGIGGSNSFPSYLFVYNFPRWILEYVLIVLLCFGVPVWALEGLKLRSAFRRGLIFARGSWTRVLFAWILVNLLVWILYIAIFGMFTFVLRLVVGGPSSDFYYRALYSNLIRIVIVIDIVIAPLLPIAVTLIYYDQRIRKEGYDIERMMEEAGMNAPAIPQTETAEGQV